MPIDRSTEKIKFARTTAVLAELQNMMPASLVDHAAWADVHVHPRHAGEATSHKDPDQTFSFLDTILAMVQLPAPVWVLLQSYNRRQLIHYFALPIGILMSIPPNGAISSETDYIYTGDEAKLGAGGFRKLTFKEDETFMATRWTVVNLGLETLALFSYNFLGGPSRLFLFGPHPCAVNQFRYGGQLTQNAIDSLQKLTLDLMLLFNPVAPESVPIHTPVTVLSPDSPAPQRKPRGAALPSVSRRSDFKVTATDSYPVNLCIYHVISLSATDTICPLVHGVSLCLLSDIVLSDPVKPPPPSHPQFQHAQLTQTSPDSIRLPPLYQLSPIHRWKLSYPLGSMSDYKSRLSYTDDSRFVTMVYSFSTRVRIR